MEAILNPDHPLETPELTVLCFSFSCTLNQEQELIDSTP